MAILYKRDSSKYWFVRFTFRGKEIRKSTGEVDKKKAEKALRLILSDSKGHLTVNTMIDRVLAEIANLPEEEQNGARQEAARRFLEGLSSKLEIQDAWRVWGSSPRKGEPGEKTMSGYEAIWKAFTKWITTHQTRVQHLHEVTPVIAEAYASFLWGKNVSPATYNAHLVFLRSLFKTVRITAGLSENVWDGIPNRSKNVESRRELTPEELEKIFRRATGTLRSMFAVGIYTGMRLGDVATLKWSCVNLDSGLIEFIPMKTQRKGKVIRMPIHPVLSAMLAELRANNPNDKLLFPEEAALYISDPPALSKRIQLFYSEVCKIKTTEEVKKGAHRVKAIIRVGFHSLRHSFVSLCAANQVPQVAIMELVGHGSPAMTRLYSHAGSEQKVQAIAALPVLKISGPKKKKVAA